MDSEIHIRIAIPRAAVRWVLMGCFVLLASRDLGSETLTLVATYPVPMGIYKTVITTDKTILTRNAGWVGVGTTTQSTDPNAKMMMGGDLDMNGNKIVNVPL